MQSTARTGTYARLKLVTLRLQHCRTEQRDLLALLQAAQNLGVVEVADTESYHARCVLVVRLYEHDHRPARSPASTTRASASSGLPETARG